MSLSLFGTIDRAKTEDREWYAHNSLPCRRSLASALGVALQRCSYPPHECRDSNMAEGGLIFVIKMGSNSI